VSRMPPATLPRAILFDLDDTILAAGQRLEILQHVAREFTSELQPFLPDEIAERLDAALAAFWSDPERHKVARFGVPEARRQVIAETFAATGSTSLSPDLAQRVAARFTAFRDELTAFFPGARETIETLKARGVLLALVTNGGTATQRAKVERFALAPLFDHIQIEGEHDFGKPDERAYLHAMRPWASRRTRPGWWATTWNGRWPRRRGSASSRSGTTPTARACPKTARCGRTGPSGRFPS